MVVGVSGYAEKNAGSRKTQSTQIHKYVLCYYLNIKFLPVYKTCLSRHHHNDSIASDTFLFYMYNGVFKFASCQKVIMVTTGRA